MDNVKIGHMNNKQILQYIQLLNCINQMKIDLPLYVLNSDRAIRLDFSDIRYETVCDVINRVLHVMLGDRTFWLCEYGDNRATDLIKKRLFDKRKAEVGIIPYHSKLIDRDWFQYCHDSIACAKIHTRDFFSHAYIKYVLRDSFLSNTIFLIDNERKIALQVYDRRGMDIAAMDIGIIAQLFNEFRPYVHKVCFAKIPGIIDAK